MPDFEVETGTHMQGGEKLRGELFFEKGWSLLVIKLSALVHQPNFTRTSLAKKTTFPLHFCGETAR